MFLEMDWATEPMWYDCTLHWGACIPTGPLIPNCLQFYLPPIREETLGCIINPCHVEDLIETITESWVAIMAIINVHPYQDSHLSPTLFNWTSLQERYPSPQAAITAHTDAVRAALSYTSFLIWWTSSIHDWTIELPELMVYNVCQLVNSCRSQ